MPILSTAYLGNIRYYTKLLQTAEPAVIEQHENFVKQSCRNRCDILGANGVISLIIPVHKTSGEKTPIRQTRIDYSKNWQHRHWNSIHSAYKNSPYFDHYAARFEPFYREQTELLWDFNREIQQVVLDALGAEPQFRYSEDYMRPTNPDEDFRNAFSDKPRLYRPDPAFHAVPYYQVFSEKMPFVPDLSILDLLFCEGPGALEIIRRSATLSGPERAWSRSTPRE